MKVTSFDYGIWWEKAKIHARGKIRMGANVVVENIAYARRQTAGAYIRHIKNILDIAGAIVVLVLCGPLMLIIAAMIMLDSPGPALYRQVRIGRFGKQFTMFKFRTMKANTPELSTEDMQKQTLIPFTRMGPLLRKTSLDELPQLFNIISGQMSFIGPRPALPTQTDVNELRMQLHAHRLKPGITGLAQAIGRDNLDNETKVGYDAQYCWNVSLLFDIKVLLMTVVTVVSARGNK